MLTNLQISNIVLIEKLNLEFGRGLNVLTGETGAGKSILLDALSLALGARSDTGLVRHGCDMASVIAEFDDINSDLKNILVENGIEYDGNLILRRTLTTDGKSRGWVNDTPVSIKVLKQIGDVLVEIHGQFSNHTLLDQSTHRAALDDFAIMADKNFSDLLNGVRDAYMAYHTAFRRATELREMLERSATERDFLAHNVDELCALNPAVGEEDDLSARRAMMMNAEKDAATLSDAVSELSCNGTSLDSKICDAARILGHIKGDTNPYQAQIDKLYDAAQTISDVIEQLKPADVDIDDLDCIEERLFAIRAAARKHRVAADDLPAKLAEMTAKLNAIDNSDAELKKADAIVENARATFDKLSDRLSSARMAVADVLRTQLLRELPDLKLGNADFLIERTDCAPCVTGIDDITFMIKTNPGMPFAPLHKAASGGELSRLMLAMRVVLASNNIAHTFVFDEIDTGISGATASAVGLRLKRLAASGQALVITHSAQVAGFADRHYKIEKNSDNNNTITTVREITADDRINEIARIISGAEITPEALATAKTLIKQ